MSFLAPLFLVGGAAILAPIIFHLIRRTTREKVFFSSLMFLQPTPPKVTRKNRLQNIFLLILRCLVLLLLAFAFARPFLQRPAALPPAGSPSKRMVILMDISASMRRENLWQDAKAKVESLIAKAEPADETALLVFDRQARTLLNFSDWTATPASERNLTVRQRLETISPTWAATHLGSALAQAAELLQQQTLISPPGATNVLQQIYLVGDLQEGVKLDGLQGFEWPRQLEVILMPVEARDKSNAGIQLAMDRATGPTPAKARARILNAPGGKTDQFKLQSQAATGGGLSPLEDVYVPAGQNRIVPAPEMTGTGAYTIVLSGDAHDFDNKLFVAPPSAEEARILYFGSELETDSAQPLYFLRRAFSTNQTRRIAVQAVKPGQALLEAQLTNAALVVISEPLSGSDLALVKKHLEQRKVALFVLKNPALGASIAELLGLGEFPIAESPDSQYRLIARVDFRHPLLAPFSDPRYSDFSKIHFWKHRQLRLESLPRATALLEFDNQDPALAAMPALGGTLLILTAGWQPSESQLALSSKFIPLLHSMLELSGAFRSTESQLVVGDSFALGETGDFKVRKPNGDEITVAEGKNFSATTEPGIYSVATATGAKMSFAVNLDPFESRTAPLAADQLEKLGVPMKAAGAERVLISNEKKTQQLLAADLENRQKIWRWALVAALVVLVMETFVAGVITRRAAV